MLGSGSWPASDQFLDFLKIMEEDMEELMEEKQEKPKEELKEKEMPHSSAQKQSPEKTATVHTEL